MRIPPVKCIQVVRQTAGVWNLLVAVLIQAVVQYRAGQPPHARWTDQVRGHDNLAGSNLSDDGSFLLLGG
ncbi:MAG: hypothetical protein WD535_05015 [Thermaerobacterales bacterium]